LIQKQNLSRPGRKDRDADHDPQPWLMHWVGEAQVDFGYALAKVYCFGHIPSEGNISSRNHQ
jgi:hypothetical protein